MEKVARPVVSLGVDDRGAEQELLFVFSFLPPFSSERGSEVAGVSSFVKAASIAWLKEFWKLGTGTPSALSLSPSVSTGAGGPELFSSFFGAVLGHTSAFAFPILSIWAKEGKGESSSRLPTQNEELP